MPFQIVSFILFCGSVAFAGPFSLAAGIIDPANRDDAGLASTPSSETITVFSPTEATDHYSNGVVMTAFKGKFYCQWQSSKTDEDSEDTWVAYAISDDAKIWTSPKILAESPANGRRTSGGWWVNGDTLVAYINEWPASASISSGFAFYRTSTDGENWSEIKAVLMKDNSAMQGVIEQDLHLYQNRILGAAHFSPGLRITPVYSDDLSGVRGFVKAEMNAELNSAGSQTLALEPSLFINADGNPVMVFRDQAGSYTKLASISTDRGETWTSPESTNFPDSRAKQSAGNLPDGSAFIISNPTDSNYRIPLAIALSEDGKTFTKAYALREKDNLQSLRYAGKAKKIGYHYPKSFIYEGYLYSSYATNKEDVEYTRIPLGKILFDANILTSVKSHSKKTMDKQDADSSVNHRQKSDALGRKSSKGKNWILKL